MQPQGRSGLGSDIEIEEQSDSGSEVGESSLLTVLARLLKLGVKCRTRTLLVNWSASSVDATRKTSLWAVLVAAAIEFPDFDAAQDASPPTTQQKRPPRQSHISTSSRASSLRSMGDLYEAYSSARFCRNRKYRAFPCVGRPPFRSSTSLSLNRSLANKVGPARAVRTAVGGRGAIGTHDAG
jgi:hypothetical protein